jgi:hypothetical protein
VVVAAQDAGEADKAVFRRGVHLGAGQGDPAGHRGDGDGHLSQVTVTAGEAGGPVVAGEAAVAYLGGVFG